MCGIAGIFDLKNSARMWPEPRIDGMVTALHHRGPDGSGTFRRPGICLGHTRLAVLDLSDAGRQPMVSADGDFIIVFNGEIYNFRELRSALESFGKYFRTETDTEVLLEAWEHWGPACIDRLDGIFAFAIYDGRNGKLFLVRDHLGVKPLFYHLVDNELAFASEPLALFAGSGKTPPIELSDLDTYFTFNYLPAPQTGLKGVLQLPAGHMLIAQEGKITLSSYWHPDLKRNLTVWGESIVAEFNKLLQESVASQLVSDAPLGLFLSGGLDSYSVALAAAVAGKKPVAFTLGFENRNYDERQAAAEYASYLGIPVESCLFAWNGDEIIRTLDAMGELLADASCFPMHQLSRCARRSATVILAGDGGDELLAGYDTYLAGSLTPFVRALPSFVRNIARRAAVYLPSDNERYGKRMVVERLITAAEAGFKRDHASFRIIFNDDMKRRLYDPDFYDNTRPCDPVGSYAGLIDEVPEGTSYLTARQYADLLFHLPSILAKVDRMSMACGLEVRVPLLRKKLVEFCLNLQDEAKRTRGKGKRILREAVANKIPSTGLSRRKAGFLPPVDRWFRENGPMYQVFADFVSTARGNNLPLLRWDEVIRLWQEHREGKQEAGFILLSILQYINWSMKCQK